MKEKWKSIKKNTKKKLANNKREIGKTGAGCASMMILDAVEEVAQTQIGHASVFGIGGIDTLSGKYVYCMNAALFQEQEVQ